MKYYKPFEVSVSGRELKDWIWHHTRKKTKYTALAISMRSVFNLDDNKFYMVFFCDGSPRVVEVPKRGEKYSLPCNDS